MNEAFKRLAGNIPTWQNLMQGVQKLVREGYFQKGAEILINRTPGRLDLMGGNDDYTGGLVFETTIREATLVAVQPRSDQTVRFYNPAVKSLGWSERVEFSLADLVDNGGVKPLEVVRDWINADPTRPGAPISSAIYISCSNNTPGRSNTASPCTSNPMCRSARGSALPPPWKSLR